MEIPIGNFFQITVHSQKLGEHMHQLHQRISQKDQQILKLTSYTQNLQCSIWQKVNKKLADLDLDLQKKKQANHQELNRFNLFLKDHDSKTQKQLQQLKQLLTIINKRVDTTKQQIQEDTCLKLSYLQKKIQNTLTPFQIQNIIREKNTEIIIQTQKNKEEQENNFNKLNQKINKHIEHQIICRAKSTEEEEQEPDQHQASMHVDAFTPRRKSRSQTRKRNRTQRYGAIVEQPSELNLFLNKIELLQAKIQAKQTRPLKAEFNSTAPSFHDAKRKQMLTSVVERLTKISQQYSQKLPDFQQKMHKINNKYEIINEQIGILSRKIDKERSQITEINQYVKLVDDKRIDQKVIENIKNNVKQLHKLIEEGLNPKLNRDVFEREKDRIHERMNRLFEIIGQKCEKNQVKKGLTFLQDKIKDLIIVMAEDKNFTKDSAVKKIQAKCLSCDKDLEPMSLQNSQFQSRSIRNTIGPSINGRASTSHLRRKVRALNHSNFGEE